MQLQDGRSIRIRIRIPSITIIWGSGGGRFHQSKITFLQQESLAGWIPLHAGFQERVDGRQRFLRHPCHDKTGLPGILPEFFQ